jgi:euchromatic histone-lysine N-methyltransferase
MANNLALVAATKSGDVAQVAHLLSQGIKVDYKEIGEDASPLGHAALAGHLEVCKLLLEAGANVLEVDDCYFTPLHNAMSKNHEDIVQLLLQPSADAISDGTTILHWMAAAEASVEQLQRVLDAGCDPTIKDDEDRLAWEWAAEAADDDNDCDNAVLLREATQKLTAAKSVGEHNKPQ